MSEHVPAVSYTVEELRGFQDADDNQRRAEHKARYMLSSWRMRLGAQDVAPNTPFARTYARDDGEQLAVSSANDASVQVVHTAVNGLRLTYDFDGTVERPVLQLSGLSEDEEPPSALSLYDAFSRHLFDCDRAEMRAGTEQGS